MLFCFIFKKINAIFAEGNSNFYIFLPFRQYPAPIMRITQVRGTFVPNEVRGAFVPSVLDGLIDL